MRLDYLHKSHIHGESRTAKAENRLRTRERKRERAKQVSAAEMLTSLRQQSRQQQRQQLDNGIRMSKTLAGAAYSLN